VTAPLTSDRSRYDPGAFGAATLRRPPSKSLALGRLRRGIRRQWLLFLVIATIVTAGGIGFDVSGGVRPLIAILFWAPLGLAVAFAVGFVRELSRNTVTSLSSFGKHRGYAILGAAPELTRRALRQLPPDKRSPLGCLALQPASPFATAFRDLQNGISQDGVVAFTSSVPGEGATTTALCTAISASQQGRSVVVIDCDLRRRALTKSLGFDPDEGVLDASEDPERWQEFVGEDDEIGLHFIPAARTGSAWRSLSASPGFPDLLNRLREHYDLVVLDCPPTLGGAEGPVISGFADRTVLVTAWDRTRLNAVRHAMRTLQRRPRAMTGVYVNRVPPEYRFGRLRGE
jgi:Mrp family chromosome partitioning ATPase